MTEHTSATFKLPAPASSRLACSECANRVCDALRGTSGVMRVDCDTPASQVVVEFDPARIEEVDIERAVETFGLELASSVSHDAYRVTGLD